MAPAVQQRTFVQALPHALTTLLSDSTQALVVLDAAGNIVAASVGLSLVVGATSADLRGRSYFELLDPQDVASARASLRTLAQRGHTELGPAVFIWCLLRPGASVVKAEHTFSYADTDAGRLFFAVLQRCVDDDPQYRKLWESEARFRSLLALSSDWYWEQDEQFRFTMFAGQRNDGLPSGAKSLIGMRRWETPGQPIGCTWAEHIAQLNAHQPFRNLILHRTAMVPGTPIIICVHGDPVFDVHGKFAGYRGIASDITRAKQAELDLADAEARHRALLNIAPDGVLVIDNEVIVFANDTFVRMMGAASAQQLLGRNMLDFVHPDYLASVRERDARLVGRQSVTEPFLERKLVRLDGSTLLVEMRGATFRSGDRLLMQSVVRDISRYRQIEDELRFSEQRFSDVAQAAGEYVWEIDAQLRYTYLSDRVGAVLGYDKQELLGRSPTEFMPQDEPMRSRLAVQLQDEMVRDIEYRSLTKDGAVIWLHVSSVAFRDARGVFSGYRGTALDVTKRKLAEEQVRRLATHDVLTGLPNRVLLQDRLQHALAKAERDKSQLAVLFIDLDKFKRINDLLGHASGDELLRQAARRLTELLRDEDTLCRIGGDEFVGVVESVGAREDLERLGAQIVAAFKEEFQLTSGRFSVGASVGAAMFPGDAQSPEELIRRADSAMYQAKAKGGGQVALYSAQLGPGVDERFRFEMELRRAVTKREFRAYLQPLFDARTGALTGAEALIRWQHPERGLLLPGRFIAAAEAANLISTLGDWMIGEVAGLLRGWRQSGRPAPSVSVNVSVQQLATGMDFVEYLEDVLQRFELPPEYLVLEVTESLLVQSIDAVASTLHAARRLGVQVAMDDFGTGYSSLHLLRQLPIDTIKIDRAFVSNLQREGKDFEVLAAITQLARALDLKIVAEGVEEQRQLELLRELGFDQVQGYLFAKPMPSDEFAERYLMATQSNHILP